MCRTRSLYAICVSLLSAVVAGSQALVLAALSGRLGVTVCRVWNALRSSCSHQGTRRSASATGGLRSSVAEEHSTSPSLKPSLQANRRGRQSGT